MDTTVLNDYVALIDAAVDVDAAVDNNRRRCQTRKVVVCFVLDTNRTIQTPLTAVTQDDDFVSYVYAASPLDC